MLMLSMMLDEEDKDLFLLFFHHHLSFLCNNSLSFIHESMFMRVEPKEVIP
jgi:hypothetical protein